MDIYAAKLNTESAVGEKSAMGPSRGPPRHWMELSLAVEEKQQVNIFWVKFKIQLIINNSGFKSKLK
jgi:hypothetical protein